MRRRTEQGFSLLEVAVAIAVVAILAAAAAPMVLKALNQQREARARGELKLIYEACFGARDRVTGNMRADFGFGSTVAASTLDRLSSPGALRNFGPYPMSALSGGWRGPYWLGSMDAARFPLDPWGRRYRLRWVTGAWQVVCDGANGVLDTPGGTETPMGDDLGYPVPVMPLGSGSVVVNVAGTPATNVDASWPNGNAMMTQVLGNTNGVWRHDTVPSGQVMVRAISGATTQAQIIDLKPGATVNLTFSF